MVCPRHMVDWPQCVCAAVAAFLRGFVRWRCFVDIWVAERAHSTMAVALCVVCASPLGVGVDRRRACPHRRDVGPWCTAGVTGVAASLGTMVLRLCVCVCVAIAVVGPTMVTPEDLGGLGG